MANLIDYLEWRGDLTFDKAPFNVVDAMIFCELAYYNYQGLIPEDPEEGSVLLKDACIPKVLLPLPNYCSEEDHDICRLARESRRFSEIQMQAFVNRIDEEQDMQFSAVTFRLGKHGTFVAFRGTDDTLTGWKENMDLAYYDVVPAQEEAVRYLKAAASSVKGPLFVGGHSKGGNLAVYSAAFSGQRIRKRIRHIFNFDGPGFNFRVSQKEEFDEIKDRAQTYVPQDSIIGLLLEHREFFQVIRSNAKNGFAQHDLITWNVTRDGIIREPTLTKSGESYREKISEWINGMTFEEKKRFVEVLFGMVAKYKTTGDLFTMKNMWNLIQEYRGMSEADKKVVTGAVGDLTSTFTSNIREKLEEIPDFFERIFKLV